MRRPRVTRKPYNGCKKALVIALDVGTTFSGVSYALLDPGKIPKIHEVVSQAGNPKIPTIIWYDRHGDVVKAGAEAKERSTINTAGEQGWTKVEFFKFLLHPKSMKLDMNDMELSHLPKSKSAVEVFGDFLKYLFRCTRSFIIGTHAGASVWKSVENDIQFILPHPNGWEGAQQSKMREAAIYAGLIPNTNEGKARIKFVTESEASLHVFVLNGFADDFLSHPTQRGFVVADAGGGTIDISSYAIQDVSPLLIEEIAPPDCLFFGSLSVSRRASEFFENKLKGSPRYSTPTVLDRIIKRFNETTKRWFMGRVNVYTLGFGSPLDQDPSVGIHNGTLKLTGDEVADLFEPSIEAAVSSIRNQATLSGGIIKSVWLTGGFASSPWLFSQLQERLAPDDIVVSRPDSQTFKSAANGAISFYYDHHVGVRVAKYTYGVECLREFDAADPERKERQNLLIQWPGGPRLSPGEFDCILARNSRVRESTTFSRGYCTRSTSLSLLSVFEVEIWCYHGPGERPEGILRGHDDFSILCAVRADLSPLITCAVATMGPAGEEFWAIAFSIEIQFGLTEFKASIKWIDNGELRDVPTSIVYDEGGNKGLEGERHSQDKVTATPPPLDTSTTPLMEPSRAHSISKPNRSPQISHPVVEDHSEFEEPKPAKVPLPKVVPALPPRDATSDSSGNGPQVESDYPTPDSPTPADPSVCRRLISRAFSSHGVIPLIGGVFMNKDELQLVSSLRGDDAQTFIDVTHEALDLPDLPPWLRRKCLRALCKICGHRGLLPISLQIPFCYDRSDTPLYRGGYADVWKGEHRGRHVAVKVLRVYSTSDFNKITSRFCKEVVTWKALRHPNVLPLLGVTMGKNHFAMASEWMANGNINEFAKAHRGVNRFELLKDVAQGLIYMHSQAMIHGDLKGANILIDQDGHARLADFGLLTIVSDPTNCTASSSVAACGTTRWMSPELLDPDRLGFKDSRPTQESDCYALGMVILEVLSGQAPFAQLKDFVVMRKVTEGERPGRPEGAEGTQFTDDLWQMLNQCWETQPGSRPSIQDILECLERVSGTWTPPSPHVDEGAETDESDLDLTMEVIHLSGGPANSQCTTRVWQMSSHTIPDPPVELTALARCLTMRFNLSLDVTMCHETKKTVWWLEKWGREVEISHETVERIWGEEDGRLSTRAHRPSAPVVSATLLIYAALPFS